MLEFLLVHATHGQGSQQDRSPAGCVRLVEFGADTRSWGIDSVDYLGLNRLVLVAGTVKPAGWVMLMMVVPAVLGSNNVVWFVPLPPSKTTGLVVI